LVKKKIGSEEETYLAPAEKRIGRDLYLIKDRDREGGKGQRGHGGGYLSTNNGEEALIRRGEEKREGKSWGENLSSLEF